MRSGSAFEVSECGREHSEAALVKAAFGEESPIVEQLAGTAEGE